MRWTWLAEPENLTQLVSSLMGRPCQPQNPTWASELRALANYLVLHQDQLTVHNRSGKNGYLDVLLQVTQGVHAFRALVAVTPHEGASKIRYDSGWIAGARDTEILKAWESVVACLACCIFSSEDLRQRLQFERSRIVFRKSKI